MCPRLPLLMREASGSAAWISIRDVRPLGNRSRTGSSPVPQRRRRDLRDRDAESKGRHICAPPPPPVHRPTAGRRDRRRAVCRPCCRPPPPRSPPGPRLQHPEDPLGGLAVLEHRRCGPQRTARSSSPVSPPGQKVGARCAPRTSWDRLATGRYVPYAYLKAARSISAVRGAAGGPGPAQAGHRRRRVPGRHGPQHRRQGQSADPARRPPSRSRVRCQRRQGQPGLRRRRQTVTARSAPPTSGTAPPTGVYISHAYVLHRPCTLCKERRDAVPTSTVGDLTRRSSSPPRCPAPSAAGASYGVPPSVTIAQAILESGWGRSGLSSRGPQLLRHQVLQTAGTAPSRRAATSYRTNECTKAGSASHHGHLPHVRHRRRTRSATTATSCG